MQAEISGAPTRRRGSSSGSWLVTLKALEILEEARRKQGSETPTGQQASLDQASRDYSRYFVSACDPALDGICVAGK